VVNELLKLNIGCGLEYKKGYVNIDAFNSSIADQIMSALDLEFDDDSFTRVECVQVLEHLGAAKSIYALAEVYRVLKRDGIFVIETPDLLNSFKIFLKGNEEQRKLVMNWIYGLDMPGMSHKYGFPEELLERMLQETGFADIDIKRINTRSAHPSLQAVCKKPFSRWHQFFARFRKKLVQADLVDLQNQVDVIDKEILLQDLFTAVLKTNSAKKVLVITSTRSPKIGQLFIEECVAENLVSEEYAQVHLRVLEKLVLLEFPKIMTYLFREMPVIPGSQSETFETVKSMCAKSVKKILSGETKVTDELRNASKKMDIEVQTVIFSKTVLNSISQNQLALGAKAFAQNQFTEAMIRYENAVRFNRDNILAYWNLARLHILNNMQEKARQRYGVTKSLVSLMHPKVQKTLLRRIETEIEQTMKGTRKNIDQPVLSLLS